MVLRIALVALCLSCSCGVLLRGDPDKTMEELQKQIAATESATTQLQAQLDAEKATLPAKAAPAPKAAAVKKPSKPKHPLTAEEKMNQLSDGLKVMEKLQNMFSKNKPSVGAEKFANGAMSEELSNKDSQVWSTIGSMLKTVQSVSQNMNGKSKADREKMMASLEEDLNGKATVLGDVTADVSKKQQEQDEEYVLGLLIMHRDNWSMEKQLNATETFMHNSPVLQQLYNHHDASKPLAPQLAALMDAKSKKTVSQSAPKPLLKASGSAKPAQKKASKAATEAAHAFIQLASTFLQSDCPYCAAQCVDKCHTAGKPYVQCLTDCADAGKSF